jgi:hypothetical protein
MPSALIVMTFRAPPRPRTAASAHRKGSIAIRIIPASKFGIDTRY